MPAKTPNIYVLELSWHTNGCSGGLLNHSQQNVVYNQNVRPVQRAHVGKKERAAFNHATLSVPSPAKRSSLPAGSSKTKSPSLAPFRFHFAFQKGELSRRYQRRRRNIEPSLSPFSTSFVADSDIISARLWAEHARFTSKRERNLPRIPRVNSNNRIKSLAAAAARFAAPLRSFLGRIWGARNNTTGVKILGIPRAPADSKFATERKRGEGGWSDAPIF